MSRSPVAVLKKGLWAWSSSSRAAGTFHKLSKGEHSLPGSGSTAAPPCPPVQSWSAHHRSTSVAQPEAKFWGGARPKYLVSSGFIWQDAAGAIPVWEHWGSFYPCLWTCPWATPPSQNDQEHEDPLPKLLSPLCHSPLGPQRSSIQAEAPTLTPRQSLRLHPGWDVYLLTFSFNILGPASSEFISFTGAYFGLWVSVLWAFERVPDHEHVVPALMLNTTLQHSRSKVLGSLLCLFCLRNPGTKLLT